LSVDEPLVVHLFRDDAALDADALVEGILRLAPNDTLTQKERMASWKLAATKALAPRLLAGGLRKL